MPHEMAEELLLCQRLGEVFAQKGNVKQL